MGIEKSNTLLVTLGVITAAMTIGVQVSSLGEIKGRLETSISQQDKRITTVESTVREHDRIIYQSLSTIKNESKTPTSRSQPSSTLQLFRNIESASDQVHGN